MSVRSKLAGLLLLLLALIAFLIWRGSGEGRDAPRADANRVDPPTPTSDRPEEEGTAVEGEDEASDVRITGTVRLQDGSPGPFGFVLAVAEVEGRRRMLSARVKSERGSFEITVPFEGASSPWRIDVAVHPSGFSRRQERIAVVPGGEYSVDFVLEKGTTLAGVVLGPSGNPVPKLEVIARTMKTPPWGLAAQHLIEPHRLLVGSGEEVVQFALGTTDESGRFELAGLPNGTYGLFSQSEDWILVHEGLFRPPDRTLRIRAVRAHSVVGTVTDARTGKPIPRATAILRVRRSDGRTSTKAVSVFDGRLWVAWKAETPWEEEFEVEVRVTADGYREGRKTLPLGRERWRGFLKLGLEPVAGPELGTTIVEVVDAWGRRVELPMSFRLSEIGRDHVRPEAFRAEPEGQGVYRLLAPEGRWDLRVWPRTSLGGEIEWRGEIRVWSGRESALKCGLPPFGILVIRRTRFPEGSPPWVLRVESADESSWLMSQVKEQERRLAVEPGEWKVRVPGSTDSAARTVTVRAGEEIVVTFD